MKGLKYQLFLFKDCCNNCSFCFQSEIKLNNRNDVGIIFDNLSILKEQLRLKSHLIPEKYDYILVTVFGGELFC